MKELSDGTTFVPRDVSMVIEGLDAICYVRIKTANPVKPRLAIVMSVTMASIFHQIKSVNLNVHPTVYHVHQAMYVVNVNLNTMTQRKTVLAYVQLTVFLALQKTTVQAAKMDSTTD